MHLLSVAAGDKTSDRRRSRSKGRKASPSPWNESVPVFFNFAKLRYGLDGGCLEERSKKSEDKRWT